jgi:DNA-binding response OmpR family regulator
MKVLLVEDDAQLGDALREVLLQERYGVTWVRSAEDAQRFIASESFDLMLLDIVLPGLSGLELLAWTRAKDIDAFIIMLTARDTVMDRVIGLDSGADDYLAKPFAMEEMLSRARAVLRRQDAQRAAKWTVGDLTIDTARRTVFVGETRVPLARREYELLLRLAASPGKVVTRAKLALGSGALEGSDSNSVDVHIHSLRKKLGIDRIGTVRGIGYLLEER